ncbi:MAG: hypothetical protein U9N41_03555 [Euryarchaeota archaeon]|nr:hypothetical protein [Euryarchaeota archaeon]
MRSPDQRERGLGEALAKPHIHRLYDRAEGETRLRSNRRVARIVLCPLSINSKL